MQIVHSTNADLDRIFALYDAGTAYQKAMGGKQWQGFERALIEQEIAEGRQYKLLSEGRIVGVFALTFDDKILWGDRSTDPAIYIHRIAIDPAFRGQGSVPRIVAWARDYCRAHGQRFIRMDTGSGNDRLNAYYVSCGFAYLGVVTYPSAPGMPAHYQAGSSSLFEMKVA
ncbi:MAG TPA: GNAT family N-acetyltransferase [Gemmatimonadales bacterium]